MKFLLYDCLVTLFFAGCFLGITEISLLENNLRVLQLGILFVRRVDQKVPFKAVAPWEVP